MLPAHYLRAKYVPLKGHPKTIDYQEPCIFRQVYVKNQRGKNVPMRWGNRKSFPRRRDDFSYSTDAKEVAGILLLQSDAAKIRIRCSPSVRFPSHCP